MMQTPPSRCTYWESPHVTKVRFIFFSGEEQGLLGSDYCVSQLSKKQVQDISAMLGKGASTKPEEFKGHHKVR